METFITSDLHLGCSHSRCAEFRAFLDSLPTGARLVLNGDIINHYYSDKNLEGEHRDTLDAIRAASFEREVIWIRGNNDKRLELSDPGRIQLVNDYAIGKRLYIAHGHRFDILMPMARLALIPARLIYYGIARLRGSKAHVAQSAKRLSRLYLVLCRHVAGNAARYAKKHGYEAVTCGHTHYVEERGINGVRYLNTGCWTEPGAAQIVVVDDEGELLIRSPSLAHYRDKTQKGVGE